MRKGEKIYMYLAEKMHNMPEQEDYKSMSPATIFLDEFSRTMEILHYMSDEDFDKILSKNSNN